MKTEAAKRRDLQRKADRGDVDALFCLGEAHRRGELGFPKDHRAALRCLELAANAGHVEAAFLVRNWAQRADFDFPATPAGRKLSKAYLEEALAGDRNSSQIASKDRK